MIKPIAYAHMFVLYFFWQTIYFWAGLAATEGHETFA
jgi:hypothetical protein